MKALVTGASSGIGREIAIYLSKKGYDLILVGRNKENLEDVQNLIETKAKVIVTDLSNEQKIKELYVLCRNEDIDVLINNAGFGVYGTFLSTDLNKELNMIDVNIKAVHILTKMFLRDMQKKNNGYILNVSSLASFQSGPLMASYYATKAYVTNLTIAINEELRRKKSNVKISCLCPGPVATKFNEADNLKFTVKASDPREVAIYAIDKMFENKVIIIPKTKMKLAKFFGRFISDKKKAKIVYKINSKKKK